MSETPYIICHVSHTGLAFHSGRFYFRNNYLAFFTGLARNLFTALCSLSYIISGFTIIFIGTALILLCIFIVVDKKLFVG